MTAVLARQGGPATVLALLSATLLPRQLRKRPPLLTLMCVSLERQASLTPLCLEVRLAPSRKELLLVPLRPEKLFVPPFSDLKFFSKWFYKLIFKIKFCSTIKYLDHSIHLVGIN